MNLYWVPEKTKLEQGEILTSIIIPKEKENGSSSFRGDGTGSPEEL